MNMGSGPRLILAIMAGLIVAICANVVLSETTGDDVTLAASLLLFMVTAVSFAWAFR
jgi:formate/nitrite transporter FocA (FNT family)